MGAWIETEYGKFTKRPHYVAPPVGAWIETQYKVTYEVSCGRAPRGRVD